MSSIERYKNVHNKWTLVTVYNMSLLAMPDLFSIDNDIAPVSLTEAIFFNLLLADPGRS